MLKKAACAAAIAAAFLSSFSVDAAFAKEKVMTQASPIINAQLKLDEACDKVFAKSDKV